MSSRRVTVPAALLVCSVESTRWPVSAAWMAISRGLDVADLADHDDVGVLAQDRAQDMREAEADLRLDLDLAHAVELVFDGVLDGEELLVGQVEVAQRGIERRRLAAAGRAGDEQDAVSAGRAAPDSAPRASGSKPSLANSSSMLERSSTRSTTFSPWIVGTVETRMSIWRPRTGMRMRPSCGRRRSAMSSRAMILRRDTMAGAERGGGASMSCSTPSMR